MAQNYQAAFECAECLNVSDSKANVAKCHNAAGRVFVCEICREAHDNAEDARTCCQGLLTNV